MKVSNTGEFDQNVLLNGHLSVALGIVLAKYTTNKTSTTPLWSRSQTRYAEDFAKRAEVAGVNKITTHPQPGPWSVVKCALAKPVVAGDTARDEPHVAAAPWRAATSPARVDQTGSQSRVISQPRCCAKLHDIFKQAQRQGRDGWFFLLV